MRKRNSSLNVYLIIIYIVISTVSCVSYSKLSYINDIETLGEPIVNPRTPKIIMPYDNLFIRVISIDEQTIKIFSTSEGSVGTSPSFVTYLVDENGNILFPFVGSINVGGLTISQANQKIQTELNEYVSNTTIIVKSVENKISIMGEVQNPGVYTFTQNQLTIYEALALGGGLTRYGNRRNIAVIRQENGKILYNKLDVSDSKIASKEIYYIQSNDVIVVEPMRNIVWSYNSTTFSTFLNTITTILALYIVLFQNSVGQ